MPSRRRNWQQADSTEWVKILREERPPSVQWPSAKVQDGRMTKYNAQLVQKPTNVASRAVKEYSPGPLPEEGTSAAQGAVVRLEKALGALDDADVACFGSCKSQSFGAVSEGSHQGGRVVSRACWEEVCKCRRQHSPSGGSSEGCSGATSSSTRGVGRLVWRHCEQRAHTVAVCTRTHCLEEGQILELKSPASSRWSTSCRRSEMHSRRG